MQNTHTYHERKKVWRVWWEAPCWWEAWGPGPLAPLKSGPDRRTQWCASFDVPTTLLVTGVLCPLVHVYGTGYQHIYASVIVSDNLNGCSRLICLVLETAALCDIIVRSAVYKSSYLLTYLTAPACPFWLTVQHKYSASVFISCHVTIVTYFHSANLMFLSICLLIGAFFLCNFTTCTCHQ